MLAPIKVYYFKNVSVFIFVCGVHKHNNYFNILKKTKFLFVLGMLKWNHSVRSFTYQNGAVDSNKLLSPMWLIHNAYHLQ